MNQQLEQLIFGCVVVVCAAGVLITSLILNRPIPELILESAAPLVTGIVGYVFGARSKTNGTAQP